MEVGRVHIKQQDSKTPDFMEEVQKVGYEQVEDALLERTCTNWGVERPDLDQVIGATYALQKRIQDRIKVHNNIQMEELDLLATIRQLQSQKEKALDKRSSSPVARLQIAQTKLDELTVELGVLEAGLKKAQSDKSTADAAFNAAVALARDKTKSSNRKTTLNQRWPGIQKKKSTADTACQKALEKLDACKKALSDQRFKVSSLKEAVEGYQQQPDLSEIDLRIQEVSVRLEFTRKRRESVKMDIQEVSNAAAQLHEDFINDHIDPTLRDEVRMSLQKLQRACLLA